MGRNQFTAHSFFEALPTHQRMGLLLVAVVPRSRRLSVQGRADRRTSDFGVLPIPTSDWICRRDPLEPRDFPGAIAAHA